MPSLIFIIFHWFFAGGITHNQITAANKQPEKLQQVLTTVWGDVYWIYEKEVAGNVECRIQYSPTRWKLMRNLRAAQLMETPEGNLVIAGLDQNQVRCSVLDRYLNEKAECQFPSIKEHVDQIYSLSTFEGDNFSLLCYGSSKPFLLKLTRKENAYVYQSVRVELDIPHIADIQICRPGKAGYFIMAQLTKERQLRVVEINPNGQVVRAYNIPIGSDYRTYSINDLCLAAQNSIHLVGTAQKYNGKNDPWHCVLDGQKKGEIICKDPLKKSGNNQYLAIIQSERNQFEVLQSNYEGGRVNYKVLSYDSLGKQLNPLWFLPSDAEQWGIGNTAQLVRAKNGILSLVGTAIKGNIVLKPLISTAEKIEANDVLIEAMFVKSYGQHAKNELFPNEQGYIEMKISKKGDQWLDIHGRLSRWSKENAFWLQQDSGFYACLKEKQTTIRVPVDGANNDFSLRIDYLKSSLPTLFVRVMEAPSVKKEKGKLYVVTIAPDYTGSDYINLQFNRRDAYMIDSLMKRQRGDSARFSEVKRYPLYDKNSSTEAVIRRTIDKLINANIDPVLDFTVIYYSGHGTINNRGEFEIIPSLYSIDSLNINLEHMIKDQISLIPGKKLLIVDACHSGKLNDYLVHNALVSLEKQSAGVQCLLSCNKWESSYEIPALKHSVFTLAMLEALSNSYLYAHKDVHPPFNADKLFVSDQDISNYASKRVPELIKRESTAEKNQSPQSNNQTGWEFFRIGL